MLLFINQSRNMNLTSLNFKSRSLVRTFILATAGLLVFSLALIGVLGKGNSRIPSVYGAQADYFLKIDGIEGESKDPQYTGAIEIESWSWGENNRGVVRSNKGGGKATFQDIYFTVKVNKATPVIMLSSARGTRFPKATLFVRKAGSAQDTYYKVILSDVMVTSYGVGGSGTFLPTEQFSLSFTKIEFEYVPSSTDDRVSAPVKAGWDLKQNKGI